MIPHIFKELFVLFFFTFMGLGVSAFSQTNDSIQNSPDSSIVVSNEYFRVTENNTKEDFVSPVNRSGDSLISLISKLRRELSSSRQVGPIIERIHDTVFVENNCISELLATSEVNYDSIYADISQQITGLYKESNDSREIMQSIYKGFWLLALIVCIFCGFSIWRVSKSIKISNEALGLMGKQLEDFVNSNHGFAQMIGELKESSSDMSSQISNITAKLDEKDETNNRISAMFSNVNNSLQEMLGWLKGRFEEIGQRIENLKGEMLNKENAIILNENTHSKESKRSQDNGITNAPIKPSLEAYNHSVYEFKTINEHISSLRRKETRDLLNHMFRFLAIEEKDTRQLMQRIRESRMPDNDKEQFVSLVSQIESFIHQKKPIIDSWLFYEPKDDIHDYQSGLRLPINQAYDDNLDRDILGDDLSGQTIHWVYKMGYYFPGNTIAAYREKSIVST